MNSTGSIDNGEDLLKNTPIELHFRDQHSKDVHKDKFVKNEKP